MAKMRKNKITDEKEVQPLSITNYCKDRFIPITIQSRVLSGNTNFTPRQVLYHTWHSHTDFAELTIVISGSASNNFHNGQTILMQAGDLMLMTPGTVHHYTGGRQFKYFDVLFDTKLLDMIPGFLTKMQNYMTLRYPPEKKPTVFHLEGKNFTTAALLLEGMMQEELNHSAGYEEALFADFCRLLIHILRYAAEADIASSPNAAAFHIAQIIFHMETNSSNDLNIRMLSKQAFMSESNFRHRFKEVTGLPPGDYLIRLRLQKAALLLFHSNYQIEQIAHDCGFSDSNYFARKFREILNTTPRDFRQKCTIGQLNITEEIKKLNLYSCNA